MLAVRDGAVGSETSVARMVTFVRSCRCGHLLPDDFACFTIERHDDEFVFDSDGSAAHAAAAAGAALAAFAFALAILRRRLGARLTHRDCRR